ncbi:MAG TPA: hypothetical protein EYP63_09425 [Desulfotomaculum sp.]|nr:hypothetical protein [Desulfotomaculum sp.]
MRRFVHLSIVNAAAESALPYFRGKGILEKELFRSGLSYAIIRPTVIFGIEDILINNIAWLLRHFPVFAVPGDGHLVRDVVITRDELRGLMAGLLVSSGPVTGRVRLSGWLAENAGCVGTIYASELRRHYCPLRLSGKGQRQRRIGCD